VGLNPPQPSSAESPRKD